MAPAAPVLREVALDDKYALDSGRVYLTGVQALVRLLMLQRQRDSLAGLEHRRVRLGLPRLAPGRTRSGAVEGSEVPRPRQRALPARPERGPRGHGDLGHAAAQPPRRREGRRRVLDVVRQGPGRGSLRRRVQARQLRGHVAARRRAGARRRRPRGEVVDDPAPVRPRVLGRADAGAVSLVGAGDPRPRAARLGDEPLLGLLGRLQVRRRHGRELGVGPRRPGAHPHHRPRRLPAAAGRRVDPLARRVPRHRGADAGLQGVRGTALLPGEPPEPGGHRLPEPAARHHHQRQELPRRAPGAGGPRPRRAQVRGAGHPRLQGRHDLAARARRRARLRARPGGDPGRRGEAPDRRVPAEGAALQLARRRAPARRRQVRREGRVGAAARRVAAARRRRAHAGDGRARDREAHRTGSGSRPTRPTGGRSRSASTGSTPRKPRSPSRRSRSRGCPTSARDARTTPRRRFPTAAARPPASAAT